MNRNSHTGRLPLLLCTVVGTIATGGSLYFSEVMGLSPCELCWIQRVGMYPLVVLLGVAVYENRSDVWRTALPLSAGGGIVAAYHSYLQRASTGGCSLDGRCGSIQYELFGVLSIPNLSLLAFTIITFVLVVVARQS